MNVNETNDFLNALKREATGFYCVEGESKEDVMIRLFEPIDDVTGFYYIQNISFLVRAVSFYLMESDDSKQTKKEVQKVLELVIENDSFFKTFGDNIAIFRSALSDIYKKILDEQKQA